MGEVTQLYMFAIMPPPELAAKIHNERMNFAEQYKFIKGLKPPVHITLFEPFNMPLLEATEFESNISRLQAWADRQTPFGIELNNYNFFDNTLHPVIFIDVIRSEQLAELHHSFIKELRKYRDIEKQKNTYKPHITIGYRDIDPRVFPMIREEYSKKRFRASFNCNAFYLWKHNGNNWQVQKEFRLNGIKDQLALF